MMGKQKHGVGKDRAKEGDRKAEKQSISRALLQSAAVDRSYNGISSAHLAANLKRASI